MKQPRPEGVPQPEWRTNPLQEDDTTFRVKLRTDMIQVVRDQHDLLQSWACQWERKSMDQIDELTKTIHELREEMRTVRETGVERATDRKKGADQRGILSYGKREKLDVEKSAGESEGAYGVGFDQPPPLVPPVPPSRPAEPPPAAARAGEREAATGQLARLHDESLPKPPEIFLWEGTAESGKNSPGNWRSPSGVDAHGSPSFADSIDKAAELAEQDPAVFYWDIAKEHFPALSRSPVYQVIGRALLWIYTAEEPPRTGLLANIKNHASFEAICMTVILANTVAIFISANSGMANRSDTDTNTMTAINTAFTIFYLGELILKLAVHRLYLFINEEKVWNIFDCTLVLGGAMEILVGFMEGGDGTMVNPAFMRCIRLLKLAKILRVVRVMRFFRELRLMLKCVVGSFVSLFWAFVMLSCFNLLFAIYFVQQVTNYMIDEVTVTEDFKVEAIAYYGSVQTAMISLFKGISGGNDWDQYYTVIEMTGWFNAGVFIFYILLIWISLTNIITSVFVEKALDFAVPGLEDQIEEKHQDDRETAKDLKELFKHHDLDDSGSISSEEFTLCLQDKRLTDYLIFRGLDVKDAQAFFKMLCSVSSNGEVDIRTIIGGCLRMRGAASNVDMLALSLEMQHLQEQQQEIFGGIEAVRKMLSLAVGQRESL